MAYLKIHCGYCGGTWDVYSKVRKFDTAGRCPHCDSKIEPTTWAKILKAYDAMNAVNMELNTNHELKHMPWFEADFINDSRFMDHDKDEVIIALSENYDSLHDEIGELRVDIARIGAALNKKGVSTT